MHPGGEGTRHQAARRRARPAAGQGPRARPVVPVGAEGIWRHGPRSAGQRAGADGARREHARRTVDEHTGARRRLDDDVLHGGHSEIEISDLKVPADNLVGGEGNGFAMGQHRLAYGRLRHGMHNVAKAQRALDMAAAHVTRRSTFGTLLADRQAVQFMLADCASELYIGRLMLLPIAYTAAQGLDIRQENSIAKIFHAHMVHKVIDTAIQLHGALGFSQDTPLAKWYTQVRSQRLVDGPDEVHKWKIGKNVIKAFREHGTTASAVGGDLQ